MSLRRAFLLSLTAAALSGCNVRPNAEIAAYGDSVSWGYGDLPGGWTRHLEEASGYTISNLGVPGERANAGADRIDAALRTAPRAKVIFILHGGNDWIHAYQSSWCNRDCDPDVVENQYLSIGNYLRRMRAATVRRGKTPVFLTYWPDSQAACPNLTDDNWPHYIKHRERLNTEIANVAAEHGDFVVHLDDLADFGTKSHFFDCLHPSASGYEVIAKRILQDVDHWAPPDPGPADTFTLAPP